MKYQIWKSSNDGKWYWRLRVANHEPIAASEGYERKIDALICINLVKQSADAPVEEIEE